MIPRTVDDVVAALAQHGYVADRGLAVTTLLSLEILRSHQLDVDTMLGHHLAMAMSDLRGFDLGAWVHE